MRVFTAAIGVDTWHSAVFCRRTTWN